MEDKEQELLPQGGGVELLLFLLLRIWSLLWRVTTVFSIPLFISRSSYYSYSVSFLVWQVRCVRAWSQGVISGTDGRDHTSPRDPGF